MILQAGLDLLLMGAVEPSLGQTDKKGVKNVCTSLLHVESQLEPQKSYELTTELPSTGIRGNKTGTGRTGHYPFYHYRHFIFF